jgi:hypothetical protein
MKKMNIQRHVDIAAAAVLPDTVYRHPTTNQYLMPYPHLLMAAFLASTALLVTTNCHSGQDLILDGREIRLNDDGTWQYLSNDRFIDTPDGKRIRLMQDGRWEYTGNTPLQADQLQRTSSLDIQLQDVVIERTEKKVQKNTRVRTRTVFTVETTRAAEAGGTLELADLDAADVMVTDDSGKTYEVISITADLPDIAPGKTATIKVVADKSPFIFDDVDAMSVTFDKQVFDTPSAVTLTRDMDDIDEVKVDRFD